MNFSEMYDNSDVRRQDRLLDVARAEELLRTAEYGVLSMIGEAGEPYGVPLNFVWDGQTAIYIHCATEGRKLRALQHHDAVSFCVVGQVQPLPERLTTLYESIIVSGRAHIGLESEERRQALRLLVRKFAPEQTEHGEQSIEKSFHRTEIIRIDMQRISGKAKKP